MSKKLFHNPEAERGCIGSILTEPSLIDQLPTELRRECFYDDVLGRLFGTAQDMRGAGRPIDVTTIGTELASAGIGEQLAGGLPALLFDLMESVAIAYHASYYGGLIVECWRRREARHAVEKMGHALEDPSNGLDDALGACDSTLRTIEEACLPKSQLAVSDILVEVLDAANRCRNGLETGFPQLDHMTTGLHGGQLIIVGARTTIGKSAFVGNIVTNLAERGEAAYVATLEMSKADFIYRMIARLSGLKMWQIKSPDIQYHAAILDAGNAMNGWPIFIDDTIPQTVSQIGAKARMLKRKHGIKLVVVDYLQLVTPAQDDRKAPREQQIAGISRALKLLAKQLNLPIIALSQLNRQVETRANKMPQLSDIRESGAVEQDADGVWLLHRPGFADPTESDTEAQLLVAKNRQGPTGVLDLEWDGVRFCFREHGINF